MLQFDLEADVRQDFGKGASRRMRMAGKTPAILYGPKGDPVALVLETGPFTKTLLKVLGRNVVLNLEIKGKKASKRYVMIKEIQKDPVHDTLVHADFYEISLKQPRRYPVPVKFVGTAKGVDLGGELHITTHVVHLTGLPLDIPDAIEVDVTNLEIGTKAINCGDLAIPAGITMLEAPDTHCVAVFHPKAARVEEGEEEVGAVASGPAAADDSKEA